ncbi:MAG TPA: NADH-quinone oxidoreductase subunit NuoG [Acidimicrobiales bacterium]|nr:NADH-quinone oxidoreductase subunit NuoG [Acidimicrobiales bacterium]
MSDKRRQRRGGDPKEASVPDSKAADAGQAGTDTAPAGQAPSGGGESGTAEAGAAATSKSASGAKVEERTEPGASAAKGAPPGMAGATGTPPPPPPPEVEVVSITVDGRQVTARKGEMMITAAERVGTYIPRFCYHPRMKPVGMCRMCLVDVKGPRGYALTPACFTPVADGQEVVTTSERVKKAQDGILEFLLINHPLDCPVCDKGGECPLQDQTLAYGPGETRFVEEKRHWDKPIPISALVNLDRERCIQCARCTRFAEEVAGDPLIDFAGRSDTTEVATFPDVPFSSNFSGNIVQICPVGALTSTPYRFRARPWDLEQVESSCTSCSVGCRVAVQSSSDKVTRYLGIDTDPVNWSWLCDKGRFDHEALSSEERLTVPLVRKGDELVEASWGEALAAAAGGLKAAAAGGLEVAARAGGAAGGWRGERLGVIGGARLANEDAYTWAKVARVALGTDNVDCQLGDGLAPEVVLGLPRATIDQATRAPLVITLAPDIKEELPVLYLRLRHAAVNDGVPIVELTPRRTGLSRYAQSTLVYRAGEVGALVQALLPAQGAARARLPAQGAARDVSGVAAGLVEATRARIAAAVDHGAPGAPSIVVILGRPTVSEPAASIAEAATALAGLPGVAFLSGLRRSNVHGALDLGLAPGILPGRVSLEDGRRWYESRWGSALPAEAGLDTGAMLAAAAEGRLAGLVLVGADPVADFPDATLAAAAMEGAGFVVAIDTFLNPSARHADVVLPAATYAERRGSFTNLEGRITWLGQKVSPPGVAWPDWMIAVELAAHLGVDAGLSSLEEIWAEIERVSPLHAGVSQALVTSRQGRNGIVVPVGLGGAGGEGEVPRPLDPMADPGIGTTEAHMVPPNSLYGSGAGRAWSAGAGVPDADVPEAEVEGRRSAPDDTPGPDVTPGFQGPPPGEAEDVAAPEEAGDPGETGPEGEAGDPAPREPPAPPAALRAPTEARHPTGSGDAVSPPAAGELRLVATRSMWDGGTLVQHSPHLAGLHPVAAVRLHPAEMSRLGVADGAAVRVSSARGIILVVAVGDHDVPEGVAAMAVNLPGATATALIDSSSAVTDVLVEPIR